LRELTNNIKPILNLTLMAPASEILSIAVKSTVSLYIRYWLNLVVNILTTSMLIIIPYYLSKLYWEVSLKVVKYTKGKVGLLKTTPVSIY
jgi:hypothetical protein